MTFIFKMDSKERKSIYRRKAAESDIPIFFQPWWLDIVCRDGNWEVGLVCNREGDLSGVLPYYLSSFLGFKVIRMPPMTPYLGVWLQYPVGAVRKVKKYSFENKVINELIGQLPKFMWYHQIHPEQMENWYPFYYKGFRQTTRYTYVFEEIQPGNVYSLFKGNVRNKISMAERGLEIVESKNIEDFLPLLGMTLKRNRIDQSINIPMFLELSQSILSKKQGIIYLAQTKTTQRPVAGLFPIWDQGTCYLWQLGIQTDVAESTGAAQFLTWHAINDAAKRQLKFNFEGSMLPHIEPVFRAFGAERKPVFQIRKFGNRFLEAAWTLFQ